MPEFLLTVIVPNPWEKQTTHIMTGLEITVSTTPEIQNGFSNIQGVVDLSHYSEIFTIKKNLRKALLCITGMIDIRHEWHPHSD